MLFLPCTSEEEEHTTSYVQQKLNDLRVFELKRCRYVCRELLTWWESERGQMEGLALNQYGNVNTSTGRTAIQQKRGDFADQTRQDEINQELGDDDASDEAFPSE